MKKVKISAAQFPVKKVKTFSEFADQVKELISQVPSDSVYVVFPELMTVGLLTALKNGNSLGANDLHLIDEFTGHYIDLFSTLSKRRGQIIIGGSHLERRGDKYYNIAYIFREDGSYAEHKKTHIFPAEADWKISEGDVLKVFDIGPAKIGLAICYEAEIPEVSRILSLQGAEIIFCPSYTFTQHGFWRARHCAQARCIENQVFFVHCPAIGEPGEPLPKGYGRSSILSPCDTPWPADGIVAEAKTNKRAVITAEVDIDELYVNREEGSAPAFYDRKRRQKLYAQYEPFRSMTARSTSRETRGSNER